MITFKKLDKQTTLADSIAHVKWERNREYLKELKVKNLLFAYHMEAGLNGWLNYKIPDAHGGWDSPTSQIRGTFTGHWLSAAAHIYSEVQDMELKARADYIVEEIGRCQDTNGGKWAFSIPEKYLHSLKAGKHFWAPQYVCHKTMMGLLDMYLYAGNEQALEIVKKCAEWFYEFTEDITRENMDHMMDIQETGGIMELWADLYAVTKDPKHLELVRRYERPKLIEPLYEGKDVLTNMHANTTIPEIHGCARAYEITGEERYRKIVENYFDLAVTQRGQYATGGQTSGEIWTPMGKQAARLGDLNQEHCTVYNMIRLADYLLRWTGEAKYGDYIEQNIYNGLFSQAYWEDGYQDTGLIAYFQPLAAGSQKKWGSKTEDFWCCHCTLVQANAKYREWIYYEGEKEIAIAQYLASQLKTKIEEIDVLIEQQPSDLGGECIRVRDIALEIHQKPQYMSQEIRIKTEKPVIFTLKLRLPWWRKGDVICLVNGERVACEADKGFAAITREWHEDTVEIIIPQGITCWPLEDEPGTVAFLDGPVVLAGLVEEERILYGDIEYPETMLKACDERHWTNWNTRYRTMNQPIGFYLKPLNEIGKEKYTVYFPVRRQI